MYSLLKLLQRSIKRQIENEDKKQHICSCYFFCLRSPERISASSALQCDSITHSRLQFWYLNRLSVFTCSFLISFLRSASYFSFWFALAALWSCGWNTQRVTRVRSTTIQSMLSFWKRSAQKIQTWWLIMQSEKSFTSLSNLFCSFWDNPINLWVEMMFFVEAK